MVDLWQRFACIFGLCAFLVPSASAAMDACHASGRADPAMAFHQVLVDGEVWIAASGAITEDTPGAFSQFLAQTPEARGVLLASEGGRLRPALHFGRDIRGHGLATRIGRPDCGANASSETHVIDAHCASACAYAFLGGRDRRASGGQLGVHQISASERHDPAELARAERAMLRELLLYVLEMGAQAELVGLAQVTPADRIMLLGQADLLRLGVVSTASPRTFAAAF